MSIFENKKTTNPRWIDEKVKVVKCRSTLYNEHTDKTRKASSSSIAWKHETTFDDVFLLFAAEDDLPFFFSNRFTIVKENEIRS